MATYKARFWLVAAEKHDWDEYDSFVVRAKTEEEALELCRGKWVSGQGKITARVLSADDVSEIILGSFNAG